MTELETLERAKTYVEKLANGIDPIGGSQVSEGDVVNNVKVSRCLFYVADVLRQVIENGGVSVQKKEKKAPFSLSIEKQDAFDFSARPIPISEIAKRINALIADENMDKLSYRAIQNWLLSIGMLEEALNSEGKLTKRPTVQGENMGITPENRMGQNEAYSVVVYDLDAQHFIMDNLDAIVDHERSKAENQGQPWLPDHDAYLRESYANGVPVKEIATTLKRTGGAIRSRLKKLGLAG